MKKLIPFFAIAALTFTSCYYYDDPIADFSIDYDRVEPYEYVYFTNYSQDADEYYWDFGDGYTSRSANPEHYYDAEGVYTVSLRARNNHGGTDYAYMDIYVNYTDLEISVFEWNSSLTPQIYVSNAEVTLYANYDDWFNLRNPIETRYTNSQGIVMFPRLNPVSYYIDVYRSDYNNGQLGQEDIGFVKTDPLYKAEVNTFIAWVDYYPSYIQNRTDAIRVPYKASREKRVYNKTNLSK